MFNQPAILHPRRSWANLTKASRRSSPDSSLEQGAECAQESQGKRSSEDSAQSTTLEPSKKRPNDAITIDAPFPTKRLRSFYTNTQYPETSIEKTDQTTEVMLHYPKPKPLSKPGVLFSKEVVDPAPDPCSESLEAFVFTWLESIGYDRKKGCRSDSHLYHTDNQFISQQLTAKSAPEITQGIDNVKVPATAPSSIQSTMSPTTTEDTADETDSRITASVKDPSYRANNLHLNGIEVRLSWSPLPDLVLSHVNEIQANRNSPGLSLNELNEYIFDLELLSQGCTEEHVRQLFQSVIFPGAKDRTFGLTSGLSFSSSISMPARLVPNLPITQLRVTQPKPDLLYGYSANIAFTLQQASAQEMVHPRNIKMSFGTTQGLRFPFFAIEFKAAGGTRGDLWVATNQCAGASAACLNCIEWLNNAVRGHGGTELVDNISYSIAVDNDVAYMYVMWKEKNTETFNMQRIDHFLMTRPKDVNDFYSKVRNILAWGKTTRLHQIKRSLDFLYETKHRQAL